MISYLKGMVAGIQKSSGNRMILTLEVNGIGYDLQIPTGLSQHLSQSGTVQVFTHLQIRDEVPFLYGFETVAQRDLFRQLLTVSGIGAATAIALLDTLPMAELVDAIITGNSQLLLQAPGIGGKTAERICLELKKKLTEWRQSVGLVTTASVPLPPDKLEDVQMTLLALGYTAAEVSQALQMVSEEGGLSKDAYAEDWIKRAIAHLTTT